MRTIEVADGETFEFEHLVLDLNGTLSNRGRLVDGVADRLQSLRHDLEVHLVTADTFGTARQLGAELGLSVTTIAYGVDKAALVSRLGPDRTVAIGNGRNDEAMLRLARLGLAVIGPEGAAGSALAAADIVCRTIVEALDLLLDDQALVATLRP